ncbi:hypothetical protein KEM60_00103 [Austwickia sp. TVS 96-490-7B]|uniref:flagellar FlbD family protein n=1 Tax=Austwickia sp. TVS 96-490-7B TaxID=2830843 RepID=UPI001C5A0E46|nr:flagellar FlbD family protein [Austwickia sp. TVS 96-490-7B]MBW3083921.1 hypothetical protein [Austwickia sp. TVS 96-490-7B]
MITVTRRNGTTFALNPDLIERVEATPDTVVTLVSGTKYIITESVDQVITEVCAFRAAVLKASTSPVVSAPPAPMRLHSVSTTEA